jgi:hypothetical protein
MLCSLLIKDNFRRALGVWYQVPRPCGALNPAVRWKQDKSLLLLVTIAEGQHRPSFTHPCTVPVERPNVTRTQRNQVQLRDGARWRHSAEKQLTFSVPFIQVGNENAVKHVVAGFWAKR